MNVVYKIVFTERKRRKNYPYYYIGSKSNCQFVNGKIFKNDKEYYGSSKYKNYSKIVKENIENITIEILHTFENYESCLKKENELHRKHNVVMSHEYFNQSYASINDFNDPNYALMKNVKSKKVCKILKNHPDVKCGLWVGITSGLKWYNNGKKSKLLNENEILIGWKPGRIGKFKGVNIGRVQSAKSIEKGVKTRYERGSYVAWNKGFKGMQSHTNKTKKKMSIDRKGVLANEKHPLFNKRWINNGIINNLIDVNEKPPIGWKFGQLKKKSP